MRQAVKQTARQVAKRATKQAVMRLAICGAKELRKGAAVLTCGVVGENVDVEKL